MPEPSKKPPFEVTPTLLVGCMVGMSLWLVLAGILIVSLKMGAGS